MACASEAFLSHEALGAAGGLGDGPGKRGLSGTSATGACFLLGSCFLTLHEAWRREGEGRDMWPAGQRRLLSAKDRLRDMTPAA